MVDDEHLWKYEHVYAILRMDIDLEDYPDISPVERVAVKKVVWTQEIAQREVDRLKEVNGHKGYVYFWRLTRLEKTVPLKQKEYQES